MKVVVTKKSADYYMCEGKIINIDFKREMIQIDFGHGRKEWFLKSDCAQMDGNGGFIFGNWVPEIE